MDVRGRMGVRYEDFLARGVTEAGDPAEELTGHSGYFSQPGVGYDPRLFPESGDRLKPGVRKTILEKLYGFWRGRYEDPEAWSTVWVAGSGVSHQFSAERGGVGDLDVLIGVNFRRFLQLNPDFRGLPEAMIAERFNQEMHDELWPTTAEYRFAAGQDPFEITFYVNPGAEDIRSINPYAAYNVTDDEWTVRPIELPDNWDPRSYFPTEWWRMAEDRIATGRRLVERYRAQARELEGELNPGRRTNITAALGNTVAQANALFDEIHLGRKQAFAGHGRGYLGPENALWQYGKLTGVIDALRKIRSTHSHALRDANEALYGTQLGSSSEAVARASLWATKYRR